MPKKTKVKAQVPLPEPEVPLPLLVAEVEPCACYSPETCSGDCPAIEGPAEEPQVELPEPEPEPEPVKPKKLRPCERIRTPEDIERKRLHTEKRRASRAAYLASLQ